MRKNNMFSLGSHLRIALIASLLAQPSLAQQHSSLNSQLSVVAQPSELPGGSSNGEYELLITNLSAKAIDAYKIQLTISSPRGPESYAVDSDLVPSFASKSRAAPDNDNRYSHLGPLLPNESLSQLIAKRYPAGTSIVSNVTGIIFDDNTVAGDASWARLVFASHASAGVELRDDIAVLQGSVANRDQIGASQHELSQIWQKFNAGSRSEGDAKGLAIARGLVTQKLNELQTGSLSEVDVTNRSQDALSYLSDIAKEMQAHSQIAEITQ